MESSPPPPNKRQGQHLLPLAFDLHDAPLTHQAFTPSLHTSAHHVYNVDKHGVCWKGWSGLRDLLFGQWLAVLTTQKQAKTRKCI